MDGFLTASFVLRIKFLLEKKEAELECKMKSERERVFSCPAFQVPGKEKKKKLNKKEGEAIVDVSPCIGIDSFCKKQFLHLSQ